MKRAEQCVDAKVTHIRFENDCLVFEFSKSKGRQDNEEHFGPWHVYANPLEPEMCPVLALAKYLFTFPNVLCGRSPLFEGESQYNRYRNLFAKMISDNLKELAILGVKEGDLGTHSLRKGVATMVAAGCTVSPPMTSLCIRAGWVLGGVRDKYFKHQNAGDQCVGRCATGLDQTSKSFAVSPPFFDFGKLKKGRERAQVRSKIGKWLLDRIPNSKNVASHTLHVAYICFASVCYHYEFLMDTLHKDSVFRNVSIFRDIPEAWRDLTTIWYPWDARSGFEPKLTGIPTHVCIFAELEKLKKEIITLKASIMVDIKQELNDRNIGGAEFFINILKTYMKKEFGSIKEKIDDMEKIMVDEQEDQILDFMLNSDEAVKLTSDEDLKNLSIGEREATQIDENKLIKKGIESRKYKVGLCNGVLTTLPPKFKFPFMTPEQLIHNWFIGNKTMNILPYCRLQHQDFNHLSNSTAMKTYRRKMVYFMRVIEKIAMKKNCWLEDASKWTANNVTTLWSKIGPKHVLKLFNTKTKRNRPNEIGWNTYYNNMLEYHKIKGNFDFDEIQPSDDEDETPTAVTMQQTTATTNTVITTTTQQSIVPPATTTTTTTTQQIIAHPQPTTTSTTQRRITPMRASRASTNSTASTSTTTTSRNMGGLVRVKRTKKPTSTKKNKNARTTPPGKRRRKQSTPRQTQSEINKDIESHIATSQLQRPKHLKKTSTGQFENVLCEECKEFRTNHRCSQRVFCNGYYVDNDKSYLICGRAICSICCQRRGLENIYRCCVHQSHDNFAEIYAV